jgi:hypothetical protein
LAEAFLKNSEKPTFRDLVLKSLHNFKDVFNKESFNTLLEQQKWDHAIELESDPKLGFCKVYPMSLEEQDELDMLLEEALSTDCICLSKSPIGTPVFLIKKKNRKLHFMQDYCLLNVVITHKHRYPLLLVDDLIHCLKGAKYFTKLDMHWGYNNVCICKGDEWKAVFCTICRLHCSQIQI